MLSIVGRYHLLEGLGGLGAMYLLSDLLGVRVGGAAPGLLLKVLEYTFAS
jgi:hypothetical protein